MWLPHEQGLLNLSQAARIFIRPTMHGHAVVALLGGGHYTLETWPTEEGAKDHLQKLLARLNRVTRT